MEQRGRPQDRPDWDYIPKYKKGASVEKALGKAKKGKIQPQSRSRGHGETCSKCGMYGSKCYCGS